MITHGRSPFLECSSKGDKRFSAFFARIKSRDNKSIEELFQSSKIFEDGKPTDWKLAKGRKALNQEEVQKLYSRFWDEYIFENPHLKEVLLNVTGLSDCFGQENHCCQATELWRIRKQTILSNEARSFANRIIVAGTRHYDDYITFVEKMNEVVANLDKNSVIFITGAAKTGADALIIRWCKENNYPWIEYPADWDNIDVPGAVIKRNRFGKRYNAIAGHQRNEMMANFGTELIAFWDNESSGTKNMIALATKKKIPITVHLINNLGEVNV